MKQFWSWFLRPYFEDVASGDEFRWESRWPGLDKFVIFRLLPMLGVVGIIGTIVCKLRARRHPMNGYRLYPRREVLELRRQILSGIEKLS